VSISSTELPLLKYVRSVVGAGKITNKRRTRTYHSPSFAYSLFSRQALTLLEDFERRFFALSVRAAAGIDAPLRMR
jgi:hypothetical protein